MNISPKADYILCESLTPRNITAGGIHIPEKAQQPLNEGKVLELGPLVEKDSFQVGEHIIFPPHAEYRVQKAGKILIFVRQQEVIAGGKFSPDEN